MSDPREEDRERVTQALRRLEAFGLRLAATETEFTAATAVLAEQRRELDATVRDLRALQGVTTSLQGVTASHAERLVVLEVLPPRVAALEVATGSMGLDVAALKHHITRAAVATGGLSAVGVVLAAALQVLLAKLGVL